MLPTNTFTDLLSSIEQKINRLNAETRLIRQLLDQNYLEEAYSVSLRLARYSEQTALLTRKLPVYTGKPSAYQDVEDAVCSAVPVKISITKEKWFYVNLPTLLPKKEMESRSYIRAYLYPALQRYFADHEPLHYVDAVLIFRHVYDRKRPERRKRDHDNIEVNTVADAIALFVLTDDGPAVCSHYYCSGAGDEDCTEVFVVPRRDFPLWLKQEQKSLKQSSKRDSPKEGAGKQPQGLRRKSSMSEEFSQTQRATRL